MEIRIRATGAVMQEGEFRAYQKENGGPTWEQTTPEVLEALGADVVFEGPQVTGGTVYQYSQRQGVEEIDGKWYTKYVLGPVFTNRPATDTEPAKSASEQEAEYKAAKDAEQAAQVRADRNRRLAECDWTQLDDFVGGKKLAWANYRQALRDVPTQAGFPWTVTWPDAP